MSHLPVHFYPSVNMKMDILMQLRNTSRGYGIISIGLHWIFAIAVYGMFGLTLDGHAQLLRRLVSPGTGVT